jgi:hypothetical protein
MLIHYYVSVVHRALSRSLDFSKSQGLTTGMVLVALGIVVGLCFFHWNGPPSGDPAYMKELITTAIISGFAPIVILGVCALLYHLVHAPADLANDARLAYQGLEKNNRALTDLVEQCEQRLAARKPNLVFKIEYWAQLMGQIGDRSVSNIIVEISVRNSGERTALSDWHLEIPSITAGPISPRKDAWQEMVFKNVRDAKTGERLMTDLMDRTSAGLGKGDIAKGTIMFLVPELQREIYGDSKIVARLTCLDALAEKHLVVSEASAINISA